MTSHVARLCLFSSYVLHMSLDSSEVSRRVFFELRVHYTLCCFVGRIQSWVLHLSVAFNGVAKGFGNQSVQTEGDLGKAFGEVDSAVVRANRTLASLVSNFETVLLLSD
jgi:hypothetical protein